MKLVTDYLDCYDHWFDRDGDVFFERVAKGSWELSRSFMFEAFNTLNLAHPRFAAAALFPEDEMIVVYVDPYAHQGDGKLLMRAGDACRLYLNAATAALGRGLSRLDSAEVDLLVGEFRPTGAGAPESGRTLAGFNASSFVGDFPGVTWRLLSCGGYRSWFKHVSFDDWRSNAGDGDLYELGGPAEVELPTGFEDKILNPVWAIDFVATRQGTDPARLLAVDFNTAPRVAGTPLAKRVPAVQLADGVRKAVLVLLQSPVSSDLQGALVSITSVNNNRVILAQQP